MDLHRTPTHVIHDLQPNRLEDILQFMGKRS
jgi:hypothetical protein